MKARCRAGFVFLLAVASSSATPVSGQDHGWFEKNKQRDMHRYEGLLDQPNAKREYDVLGFFAQFAEMPALTNRTQLHVKYFLPPQSAGSSENEQVFIQAKQFAGRTNYLMKAGPEATQNVAGQWNEFYWRTRDVIDGAGIPPGQLGIMVRLGSDNEYTEDLAPAVFYSGNSMPQSNITGYALTLRVRLNSLTSLSCQLESDSGTALKNATKCFYTASHSCQRLQPESKIIEAGSLVTVCMDMENAGPGPVLLHIEGQYKNSSDKLVANYRFYHQRQIQ
jgi:hypothetical protein